MLPPCVKSQQGGKLGMVAKQLGLWIVPFCSATHNVHPAALQISYDMVTKKLKEIVMARGKKGVDRNEQVDMLTYLATVAKGPVQKMDVLIQVRLVMWLVCVCSAGQGAWDTELLP